MSTPSLPTYRDLLWPTLKALEEKGGSASNQELSESVPRWLDLSDEILDVLHDDGPMSEVDYRAAWARTHLKMIGAVSNSSRGVWALTDEGRQIASDGAVRQLVVRPRHLGPHELPATDSDSNDFGA